MKFLEIEDKRNACTASCFGCGGECIASAVNQFGTRANCCRHELGEKSLANARRRSESDALQAAHSHDLASGFASQHTPCVTRKSVALAIVDGRPSPSRSARCKYRPVSFVAPGHVLRAHDAHVIAFFRECVRDLHHARRRRQMAGCEIADSRFHQSVTNSRHRLPPPAREKRGALRSLCSTAAASLT